MRWVALATVFLSFPLFAALVSGERRDWRDHAVLAIGTLLLCVGILSPSAAIYVWPGWHGISKGIFVSLVSTLALALLFTRPWYRQRISFLPLFAMFFLSVIWSTFFATNKVASAFVLSEFIQSFILFVALAGELQRPTAIRALLRGLAIGLLIQASYVVRQKIGGMIQAPGTFDHQNILGLAVELSIFPIIAAVLEGERSKLMYAGIAAGAICVAGSGSRGAIGFFAVGAILVIALSVLRRGSRRKWFMVGLGVIASVGAGTLAFATLSERFGTRSYETEETARSALADAARRMATDFPLTGVGANNFVVANNIGGYISRSGTPLTRATLSQPAHSAYLVARAELGFPGEAALILLLGGLATASMLTAFSFRRSAFAGISLGTAGAIFAVSLHSNYEYALLTSDIMSLLFTVAALISALRVVAPREVKAASQQRVRRNEATGPGMAPKPPIDGLVREGGSRNTVKGAGRDRVSSGATASSSSRR